MPNIPGSPRADVPELPDGALDALLTGDLVTDEACAGLQPAASLLAALNAAPQDGELAGHARVLAEFRHRGGRPVHARRSARRRPRLLTALLTARAAAAAAAAAAAVLGGVAAAAYTSTLPAPAQQFAHSVIGAPSPQPTHRPGTPQATPARPDAAGPDAAGPAGSGLCTAYAHAKAHGAASQKAMAFRNLAAAAGGAAKIAAYCTAVPRPGSSQPSRSASAPAYPAGQPASHPTGKPSSRPTPHPAGRPSSAPAPHPAGRASSAPAAH
ncbi:MAG TPA: hypothetical protein VNO54_11580 [Streptosporangiaceae bacterium]|nr:hypothetical protein [Streptosporangiaceae bacterium]